MSGEIQKAPPQLLVDLGERYGMSADDVGRTLVQTLFPKKNASLSEVLAFAQVAHEYGLNPFLKQIYAFPAKGGGIIPIVSVDGWYRIINQNPTFNGMECSYTDDEHGPVSATCSIYRKDRDHPVTVTEFMAECNTGSPAWKKAPRRMLRHRAITQCARVAFGISGIHEPDEGEFIANGAPVEESPELARARAKIAEATEVEAEVVEDSPQVAMPEALFDTDSTEDYD